MEKETFMSDSDAKLDTEDNKSSFIISPFFAAVIEWYRKHTVGFPLVFLGLGVYRAWTIVSFNNELFSSSLTFMSPQTLCDITQLFVFAVAVVISHRIGSLCIRFECSFFATLFMIAATLFGFALYVAGNAPLASIVNAIIGGIGLAVMILAWSEVYSTLSPSLICLSYSASIAVGQLISLIYLGFDEAWLPFMTALLPLVSFLCLCSCINDHKAIPQIQTRLVTHTFPWKPVSVIALLTLAFLFGGQNGANTSIPGWSPGALMASLAVVCILWLFHEQLDLGKVYGIILPFFSAALLLLSTIGELSPIADNMSRAGYALSQIYVFTMIGSLCYHWRTNPLWLFGIERIVRTISQIAGRLFCVFAAQIALPLLPIATVMILIATFIVLSERRLDSSWGIELAPNQRDPMMSDEVSKQNTLVKRCSEIASKRNLSQREEEVLILLAQHKTAHDIEEALCIANGTAKAHIRHVYQKLDIHTREELFAMTGEEPGE